MGYKFWLVFKPSDDQKIKDLTGLEDDKNKIINFPELSNLLDQGLPKPTLVIQGPGEVGIIYHYNTLRKKTKKLPF